MSGKKPKSAGFEPWPGWTEAGFMTLKREISRKIPLFCGFTDALAIIVPDFARMGRIPLPEELLFFDLETTGLSGGAGTVAFLAAFGRISVRSDELEITQYLLLDYPGECDFIEKAAEEFAGNNAPVVVSYNGKAFDSQIFNNRCLMNGVRTPGYFHADLLHPSRRLWKNVLPNCSQSTIEVSILGLDRTGDISGAFAPDIWFSFLRNGDNSDLIKVCRHNEKDIFGLARLFLALAEIAEDPVKCCKKFNFDEETLAISWDRALRTYPFDFRGREKETAENLLENAARKGYKQAAYNLAVNYFKNNRSKEGRLLMRKIAEEGDSGSDSGLRAAALKALAIDAEWRLRDSKLALVYTNRALALGGLGEHHQTEMTKRLSRLEKKTGGNR